LDALNLFLFQEDFTLITAFYQVSKLSYIMALGHTGWGPSSLHVEVYALLFDDVLIVIPVL
jgi:hypothetical protein